MLVLVLLLFLALVVALFALQNAESVVVRFWPWEFQASVALLTIGALTVGALMAGVLTGLSRLTRWRRRRPEPPGVPAPPRPASGPPVQPGTP